VIEQAAGPAFFAGSAAAAYFPAGNCFLGAYLSASEGEPGELGGDQMDEGLP
jgi:hypothetical protein